MLVMEYTTPRGTKIQFYDDAYRDCTPEELKRRERDMQRTAWWCWARAHERRAAREKEKAGGTKENESSNSMPEVCG